MKAINEETNTEKFGDVPPVSHLPDISQSDNPATSPTQAPTYLKPFHIRLAEYNARRAEIFSESIPSLRHIRSSDRIKNFWKNVKQSRRKLLSSIFDNPRDIRPYATVRIFGKDWVGLLDTGASVSCLGSKAALEILDSDIDFKRIRSFVKTADGRTQTVCGYVVADVNFRGIAKNIKFYIVPDLAQDLYLGIDFWRVFDLLPTGLISSVSSDFGINSIENAVGQRLLSETQRVQLKQVIGTFPSFATEGLGRTTILSHMIDVGNKTFPSISGYGKIDL